jgi:hypothetical protein
MPRYAKPETADRVTINKESIVSPSQPLVSKEAKDGMKEDYQKNKESVDNSKPIDGNLDALVTTTFEDDSNHTEYELESNTSDISLTGNTISRASDDDGVQIISFNSNIYDDTDFTKDDNLSAGLYTKTSEKYGDYSVNGENSTQNTNFKESKFEIPKGLKFNIRKYSYNFFNRSKTKINQIVLHHTVSSPDAGEQIIKYWNSQKNGVATHFVLAKDGTAYQAYDLDYWAYHLGLKDNRNVKLNKNSVGIEISNWGGLIKKGIKLYNVYKQEVKDNGDIIYFQNGFRGYYYYQRYTKEQIGALRELILYISDKYNVPLSYNDDMWDYTEKAMNGKPGIWTHVSYRKDKSDCFPQDDLIGMLKGLS